MLSEFGAIINGPATPGPESPEEVVPSDKSNLTCPFVGSAGVLRWVSTCQHGITVYNLPTVQQNALPPGVATSFYYRSPKVEYHSSNRAGHFFA
jgi:hypothetical protein